MDTQESPRSGLAGFLEGHGELLVWGVVLQCLILVPLLLLSQGYLPPDDCLRHAAKAVDGRAWSEILVLRQGILSDPHVAWNGLLRGIHLLTGWGPDGLVALTVAGLFLLVMAAPLYWFKAPEAWLGSWVLLWVAGGSQIRPILGRPFLVPMAALLALMCLWTRGGPVTRRGWALSTALFGAGALLHGAWYLFALVPLAFLVAGRLRDGGVHRDYVGIEQNQVVHVTRTSIIYGLPEPIKPSAVGRSCTPLRWMGGYRHSFRQRPIPGRQEQSGICIARHKKALVARTFAFEVCG